MLPRTLSPAPFSVAYEGEIEWDASEYAEATVPCRFLVGCDRMSKPFPWFLLAGEASPASSQTVDVSETSCGSTVR